MLISVGFWESMHGYAMDSRTRDALRKKTWTYFDSYIQFFLSFSSFFKFFGTLTNRNS